MKKKRLSKWLYLCLIGVFIMQNYSGYSRNVVGENFSPVKQNSYSLYEIVVVELKRREGFSSTPYRDGDGWTIGYGQHYKQKKDIPTYPINEKYATQMLQKTLEKELDCIKKRFPSFDEYKLWAVLSLSYNIGLTKMKANEAFWNALTKQNLPVLKQLWLTTFSTSENRLRSRKLEWALFTKDLTTVRELHLEGKDILRKRYIEKKDFALKKD